MFGKSSCGPRTALTCLLVELESQDVGGAAPLAACVCCDCLATAVMLTA